LSNKYYLLFLVVAAVLEVGGDALVRIGLNSHLLVKRIEFLLLGGVVLFCYGVIVNLPGWDFGRLLGTYVSMFFFVAQAINYFSFGQKPTVPTIVGGALIIGGGLVISLWRT